MGNSIIVTSTDAVVDDNFPKVTGTTVGEKHLMDVSSASATRTIRVDEVSSNLIYVGRAAVGTADSAEAWKIFKIEITGTVTAVTWADGNDLFDNIWNDRASLSYS